MKCGLKDGFFSILLISLIFSSEELEVPLLLSKIAMLGKPTELHHSRTTSTKLQDSFPDDENTENKYHKIVKKQMADLDYEEMRNNQKFNLFEGFGCGDGVWFKGNQKTKRTARYFDSPKQSQQYTNTQRLNDVISEDFLGKIKEIARNNFLKRRKKKTTETISNHPNTVRVVANKKRIERDTSEDETCNSFLKKTYVRVPDKKDNRCYYECEEKPFGCMKLRHKKCPNGEVFSHKYLRCMKLHKKGLFRSKRLGYLNGKTTDITSEEPEPSNEWLDATQGSNQKVPPEFKAKKAPGLKIYHLKAKRTLNKILTKRHAKDKRKDKVADEGKDNLKRNKVRQHSPRSFLIRIKKKEGKNNQEESIAENDENDTDEEDEEDEESDEDEEEEETDDEDEETEEEKKGENKEKLKSSPKESLKDLIKSAKAAVTNRVRFNEPTEPEFLGFPGWKNKKPGESGDVNKNKKVLIDANIKVDKTISNALKQILKTKEKEKESNSRLMADVYGVEGNDFKMHEHLIENNARVKRYFLANRGRLRQN